MKAIPIGLALLAALVVAPGCSRDIGDECATSVDCDPNGTRACDLSQPGGYCTILGCTATSCPSGASCIRLFPVQYLSTSCNAACEDIPACCNDPDTTHCEPCDMADPMCVPLPPCSPACALTGSTNACAPDELCVDRVLADGSHAGLCARRALEQRYCAKDCSNDGDCRSGYECRLSGGDDGSLDLSPTPDQLVRFCAPKR